MSQPTPLTLDLQSVRSQFPALSSGFLYADNAGGSQVLQSSIDRLVDYLTNTNVQLGADYPVSVSSTTRVDDGPKVTAQLINAASPEEVVYGPSSTMLAWNLSHAIEGDILGSEEIIVTGEHEANAGGWKKLAARRNLTLKIWPATPLPNSTNPYEVIQQISTLTPLITSKTRIVAFSACSNILGTIIDVKAVVEHIRKVAKEKGARKVEICVDCVAYAPHRRIDVQAWDVDYCFFSYYKVYAPHIAVLYTKHSSLISSLSSIAHHFLNATNASKPYKLQPGGPGYEVIHSTTAVLPYIASLAPTGTGDVNADLNAGFEAITNHEQDLLKILLGYLTSDGARKRGVRVVGSESIGLDRVPTVSFVVVGERPMKSRDVVKAFDDTQNMGIRYGHFYAYTLIASLDPPIDADDAIVRISLVHYNTVEEAQSIIDKLKEVLA